MHYTQYDVLPLNISLYTSKNKDIFLSNHTTIIKDNKVNVILYSLSIYSNSQVIPKMSFYSWSNSLLKLLLVGENS